MVLGYRQLFYDDQNRGSGTNATMATNAMSSYSEAEYDENGLPWKERVYSVNDKNEVHLSTVNVFEFQNGALWSAPMMRSPCFRARSRSGQSIHSYGDSNSKAFQRRSKTGIVAPAPVSFVNALEFLQQGLAIPSESAIIRLALKDKRVPLVDTGRDIMEKKQFQAESKRLAGSDDQPIYTHKEIFLREIISNASDAIDKLAYQALTDEKVGLSRSDFAIQSEGRRAQRTLTVSDNGIGMDHDEMETTPARSAAREASSSRGDGEAGRYRHHRPVRRGLLTRPFHGGGHRDSCIQEVWIRRGVGSGPPPVRTDTRWSLPSARALVRT